MGQSIDIYRELQRHLDNMPVGFPATKSGVELRILKRLFNTDEAEIVLNLSMFEEPIEKIYKRMKTPKISVEELKKTLDNLVDRGLIAGGEPFFYNGVQHYGKLQFVIGIYEGQLNKLTKELVEDMEQYLEEGIAEELMSKAKTVQMRIIPVNKSIEKGQYDVASYDQIEEIIKNKKGQIAVMNCVCVEKEELLGNHCKKSDIKERCFTFDIVAKYIIKYGIGRELTKDEALTYLKKLEEIGLVFQAENVKDPLFMCCCCDCCCLPIQAANRLPKFIPYSYTNFYASVDAEKCIGCGVCLNRCNMDAISIIDNVATINLERCIGCGLCKTTCEAGAISLIKKKKETVPPEDTIKLYRKILYERFGPLGTIKILAKKALRKKV